MATRKPKTPTATAGETAIGSYKPVDSLRHDKGLQPIERTFIPSREEAGQEAEAIAGLPTRKAVPLNPVTRREQDPELYWLGKYGDQSAIENPQSSIDLRSIYRHEHIAPEQIIRTLHRTVEADAEQPDLLAHTTGDLFGNALSHDELEKIGHYYTHSDGWTNRLM